MNRRNFLCAAAGLVAAPWVCTKAGVLMPAKKIVPDMYSYLIGWEGEFLASLDAFQPIQAARKIWVGDKLIVGGLVGFVVHPRAIRIKRNSAVEFLARRERA